MAWVAVNVPAFVLSGGNAAEFVWAYVQAGPGDGSIWTLLAVGGRGLAPSTSTLLVIGLWTVAAIACVSYAARCRTPPSVSQVAFVLLVAVLIVGKSYEPGYVLWLLPLAVLAHPHWRDLLIWQAAEVCFILALWWHLGGFTTMPSGYDLVYVIAIIVRIGAEVWLAYRVLSARNRPGADVLRGEGPAAAVERGRLSA